MGGQAAAGASLANLGQEGTRNHQTGYPLRTQLPDEIIEVLRWHVETQLVTEAQRDCELLFPSLDGDFRSGSVLNKPLRRFSEAMGLRYQFTARGMRTWRAPPK